MHQRRLPSFQSLSSFLSFISEQNEISTISAPISMHLEATELHRRVIANGGPVLRLEHPLNANGVTSPLPVVTNLFGTRQRVAWGLGTDQEGLASLGELLAWMQSPKPPRDLRQAWSLLPAARNALHARPRATSAPREW